MNPSLVAELLEEKSPTLRILYGVATGANTVLVAGSTVAVVLPALSPVVNGDYVAVLATGADRLILGPVADTAWTDVTFTNSWVNAGTYGAVRYRKVGDDVQVRGRMINGTNNTSAFTLDVGFRPPSRFIVPIVVSGFAAGGMDLLTDGTCLVYGTTGQPHDLMFSFSVTP